MGSYNEFMTGRGKNKSEAYRNACDEYIHENGHRCSIRDTIKAKMVKRVPPDKMQETVIGRNTFIASRPDETAPESEWLEVWEFEVWVHS
jgi:hypothetical protein